MCIFVQVRVLCLSFVVVFAIQQKKLISTIKQHTRHTHTKNDEHCKCHDCTVYVFEFDSDCVVCGVGMHASVEIHRHVFLYRCHDKRGCRAQKKHGCLKKQVLCALSNALQHDNSEYRVYQKRKHVVSYV